MATCSLIETKKDALLRCDDASGHIVEVSDMDNMLVRRQDLIENPTPRVPVCLVLDVSPSMSGEVSRGAVVEQTNPRPIDELNEGIQLFFGEVKRDDVAQYACETAVVAFSDVVKAVQEFRSLERVDPTSLRLQIDGSGTHLGEAVRCGLEMLDRRKAEYKSAGVDYYQPWLVLMTDGQPTDESHNDVSREVTKRVLEGKLTVFPIGIGEAAAMDVLKMFSPKREPLKLRGLRFKEFFEWLSQSVIAVSQSTPGETVSLDVLAIKGWAELQ